MKLGKRLLSAALSAILLLSAMAPASAAEPALGDGDDSTAETALIGDVNVDGTVDTTDARLVLQHAVGKSVLKEEEQMMADVNGDGWVNTTDARLILQYAVGKIEAFPTPFEGEVDFRVLEYTIELGDQSPEYQFYIARSVEEFTYIREQVNSISETSNLDELFFKDRAAIVLQHSFSVTGPRSAVDRMIVNRNHLTIYTTTGSPNKVSDAPSREILLLSVNRKDVENILSNSWEDTFRQFSKGEEELYRNWYQDWLETNGYKPAS